MKKIKVGMIVLFILTIFSIYGSFMSWTTINNVQHNDGGFLFNTTTWIYWLWLPIPILSIILGYKYKKRGIKCTKNIVIGYIVGIILLLFGFLWLNNSVEDYNKIDSYRKVVSATLPENGRLEIIKWDSYSDSNKNDAKSIYVNYYKEDTKRLEKEIKQSENWMLSTDVKETLMILYPAIFIRNENTYFSVYNETLDEYNTLPKEAGKYKIYAMKYDMSLKTFQIDIYNYEYK